jgi:hypothetical protein
MDTIEQLTRIQGSHDEVCAAPPIAPEVSKLQDLTEVLAARFSVLEDRINPVLSPFDSVFAQVGQAPEPPFSAMACNLGRIRERLEHLAGRIDNAVERVEL